MANLNLFSHQSFLSRIHKLNQKEINEQNHCVIYYMQTSVRTEYNHALEYAIAKANALKKPLIVVYCLVEDFPEANERSFAFLLQGLQDVKKHLANREIPFYVYKNNIQKMMDLFSYACVIITDKGYLKVERQWKNYLAEQANVLVLELESNVIVPVTLAAQKEAYAAYSLRPKLSKLVKDYLIEVKQEKYLPWANNTEFLNKFQTFELDVSNWQEALKKCNIDRSVKMVSSVQGGEEKAQLVLQEFIQKKLQSYEHRSNPSYDVSSSLSPYLHFGHISPLQIYLQVMRFDDNNVEAFLEQLLVRRELAINFVYFNSNYDSFTCLPDWAKQTLELHKKDNRDYLYTKEQFEEAMTHDEYWNCAQMELLKTGKMHNYMRMYWGKKILEWTWSPQQAFEIALYLNNKYALDGRDPNGFAGVAWCFGKHDRPWFERAIFGSVRYMNKNGLNAKFDMNPYVLKNKAKNNMLTN